MFCIPTRCFCIVVIFALIVTALSNVTLVKDNLEKYVNDSVLYPYLREAGSYLINLDTSAMGLTVSDTTEIAAPSDINASVETNASITETDNSTEN